MAEWSKAWIYGHSLAGVAGWITPVLGLSELVRVVCCQVEVSATGQSLVQRGPTDCGVSECDRRTS